MMAEGRETLTVLDGEWRAFEQALARALKSKGNLLTLSRCAGRLRLGVVEQKAREQVSNASVVTDIDRGRALWNLIGEAIDRLRPADSEPERTPAWQLYSIVRGIYVQGKSVDELATALGISPRTLYRERRAAVEALATVVWQIEQQRHLLPNGRGGDSRYPG
jgi:AraC-like DNA-binding protein